jgi:hypothetical protein
MYLTLSPTTKNFREARAMLATLTRSPRATIILDRHSPIAILVPVDTLGMTQPGPHDRRLATCRKLFTAALEDLRTH